MFLIRKWFTQDEPRRLWFISICLKFGVKVRSIQGLWFFNFLLFFSILSRKPNFEWKQFLGSGSWSVGSARFWFPGSGSLKLWGSTDPDPMGKISAKRCKIMSFTLQIQIWTIKKREIIKFECSIKFQHKCKRIK